ncbi:hypothetical protein O6H91_18G072800 [Diphasiastrum complanatum]|uniref:Uncharacterized protein n=1 Tax=Diphasiastrum complanatum TaxID=34168 RepID=A0ACC2B2M1_DIPCM|nr:hypothetical protein O6H91_18G072800 [Diphasiastrum complanatum]
MTGSLDPSKKAQHHNGTGKPKLERMNATKNDKYVPKKEGSPTDSLLAHKNRNCGVITGDSLKSFRLSGNNVEEEVQQICNIIGISRNEFLGIPQAAWQSLSDRKTRSGPLSSAQETSPVDSEVHRSQTMDLLPAQNLDSWTRATSDSPDSSTTFQNKPLEPSFNIFSRSPHDKVSLSSDKQKIISSDLHLDSPHEESIDSNATGGTNASLVGPAKGLSVGATDTVATELASDFVSPLRLHLYRKITETRPIFTPNIVLQSISERNPLLDIGRPFTRRPAFDSDTTSSNEHSQQRDAPLSVSKIEKNLQLQKSESNQMSRFSPTTASMPQEVLEDSVPATSRSYNVFPSSSPASNQIESPSMISAGTSQALLPGSTAFATRQGNTSPTSMGNVDAKTSLNEDPSRTGQDMDYVPPRIQWSYWRKGDLLGSGSFGTVYEGVNSEGLFFAVKEVSLGNEGRGGQQSILQLEQVVL